MLVPRPDKCAVAALNCETIQGGTRVNQDLMHGGAGLTEVTLEFQNDQTGPWTPTSTKAAIDPLQPFSMWPKPSKIAVPTRGPIARWQASSRDNRAAFMSPAGFEKSDVDGAHRTSASVHTDNVLRLDTQPHNPTVCALQKKAVLCAYADQSGVLTNYLNSSFGREHLMVRSVVVVPG